MLANNRNLKRKNGEQGFTLVELIVVMAILALLAGLVIPEFGNILSDSKTKAHKANKQLIEAAVEICYTNGDFDSDQLNGTYDLMTTLKDKGYLKSDSIIDPMDSDKKYMVKATEKDNKLIKIDIETTDNK
ncbi:MAG: prepilin-type N-terminal cleavage/methylation domain-containing protein [Syntrophomonadaceae bacterium]|nr:prepilin-type N-terminal cleavage/methylation domain-containing protein [Syntrophomonadaceae bacterium]MDD3023814.1 prepilin-type N-terminal cleavage/methylation domain-containing protein [Syntrophomonadaceae bacterium]